MHLSRHSGILLHLTSLPGPHGSGDLGPSAYHFVDWLVAGRQSLWQVLPLGGIGPGNSPYMSPSASAGNELLIDLAQLVDHGWLDADALVPDPGFRDERVGFPQVIAFRTPDYASVAAAAMTPEAGPDITVLAASPAAARAGTVPPLPFITSTSRAWPACASRSCKWRR